MNMQPERSKEAMAMLALHEALRNVCVNFDWTYSVFWTIRPRPRCRGGTNCKVGEENGSLMLMWEDGYCQLERAQLSTMSSRQLRLDEMNMEGGDELDSDQDPIWKAFRKMSIQLYNYGEGLMGKVASDKCHKWVFKESPECDVGISSYWQSSFDAHPPEWIDQFAAGIQTIAVIQAGQGLLQLGSCKVVAEDLHFVLRMRHAFESLRYPSGLFLPQPFAVMRNGGAASVYNGFTPPPSPHSWSLCTLPSLEAARFRAGLFKPSSEAKVAFDKKDDQMLQSPRLSLNTGSSVIQQAAQASSHKIGKEFPPQLAPQKRDGGVIQETQGNDMHFGSSHVAPLASSKLYQRRSGLMPKFHQGLPLLNPGNPPPSISHLEALFAQQT